MTTPLDHRDTVMPADAAAATLVGRVHDPAVGRRGGGPRRRGRRSTGTVLTMSNLLDRDDPVTIARSGPAGRTWSVSDLLDSTLARDYSRPHLLAPFDLQVVKAAGVTFVRSMLERVIEENAKGDPARANQIRQHLGEVIGGAIARVTPGSVKAARVKEILTAEGLWSQYLEVGIGPDPEIFTKAPVLAAVGAGADIGVLSRSV